MSKHQTILTRPGEKFFFYGITTKEILVHLVILKASFENEPLVEAKVSSKTFPKFFVQWWSLRRRNSFFLLLASLPLLFQRSLSQKLELSRGCWRVLFLSPGGTETQLLIETLRPSVF